MCFYYFKILQSGMKSRIVFVCIMSFKNIKLLAIEETHLDRLHLLHKTTIREEDEVFERNQFEKKLKI